MESLEIQLRIPDEEGWEKLYVQPVAPNVYRLEDTPLFTLILANSEDDAIHVGDVIEVEPLPDGTHRLVRIVERSPMRHFTWVVASFFSESAEYRRFGAAVKAAGGYWEGAMGGILWVHLPPDSDFDPEAELDRRIAAAKSTNAGA